MKDIKDFEKINGTDDYVYQYNGMKIIIVDKNCLDTILIETDVCNYYNEIFYDKNILVINNNENIKIFYKFQLKYDVALDDKIRFRFIKINDYYYSIHINDKDYLLDKELNVIEFEGEYNIFVVNEKYISVIYNNLSKIFDVSKSELILFKEFRYQNVKKCFIGNEIFENYIISIIHNNYFCGYNFNEIIIKNSIDESFEIYDREFNLLEKILYNNLEGLDEEYTFEKTYIPYMIGDVVRFAIDDKRLAEDYYYLNKNSYKYFKGYLDGIYNTKLFRSQIKGCDVILDDEFNILIEFDFKHTLSCFEDGNGKMIFEARKIHPEITYTLEDLNERSLMFKNINLIANNYHKIR